MRQEGEGIERRGQSVRNQYSFLFFLSLWTNQIYNKYSKTKLYFEYIKTII